MYKKSFITDVLALQKPVVVFVMNAGALALDQLHDFETNRENPLALIEAFYPGPYGAQALAGGIFGKHNRWGRLPYTIYPGSWADQASMLEHDLSVPPGRTYQYVDKAPLYPFGHGLSLTQWDFGSFQHASCQLETGDTSTQCIVDIVVVNRGPLRGDCVVLGYFVPSGRAWKPEAGKLPLKKQLFGFERLSDLSPGTSTTSTFSLDVRSLAAVDEDTGDLISSEGSIDIVFDVGNGAQAKTFMTISISGPDVILESMPSEA